MMQNVIDLKLDVNKCKNYIYRFEFTFIIANKINRQSDHQLIKDLKSSNW